MNRTRSIAYGTIILGLALGTGQWMGSDQPAIAATPEAPQVLAKASPPQPAPVAVAAQVAEPAPLQAASAALPAAPRDATISQVVPVAAVADAIPDPVAEPSLLPQDDPAVAQDECAPALELLAEPDAMIGVTLVAPCQQGARIVLIHGGLTVTAQATATGSVFTSLPALDAAGEVAVLFPDGSRQTAALAMPETADLRRFAVQWQADDTLILNAFADSDAATPAPHATLESLPIGESVVGKVITLGDRSVALPMLAQVYTYPADASPALTVEAQVTAATCARDLLGETLESTGGRVTTQELTLPMPDCDAAGEFLVLNIPAPDLTLAFAE